MGITTIKSTIIIFVVHKNYVPQNFNAIQYIAMFPCTVGAQHKWTASSGCGGGPTSLSQSQTSPERRCPLSL